MKYSLTLSARTKASLLFLLEVLKINDKGLPQVLMSLNGESEELIVKNFEEVLGHLGKEN